MKKASLLLALVGMIFLTSCEKENTPSSLAGTTWKDENKAYSWMAEISFTATHAFYYSEGGSSLEYFIGTYTYDAPNLSIEVIEGDSPGFMNSGSVKGHTLTLHVQQTEDMFAVMELKKR